MSRVDWKGLHQANPILIGTLQDPILRIGAWSFGNYTNWTPQIATSLPKALNHTL